MIGLGLGLGLNTRSAGAAVFNPATLSLTGWWRASYAGSPWTPTASAGTSGSAGNFTEATNPPAVGSAVNGFTPLDADGINDLLTGALLSNAAYGAAGFAAVLFKADTAVAAGAEGYNDPGLISDPGGPRVHLSFADSGLRATLYTGAFVKTPATACATGSWHWGFMYWSGGTLYVQCDANAPQSVAVGAASLAADPLVIGKTPVGPKFFDGQILEVMTASSNLSSSIANIIAYGDARYGLSI